MDKANITKKYYYKSWGKKMFKEISQDAYSKKIMGYHVSDDMKATSTLAAVQMAIENRIYAQHKQEIFKNFLPISVVEIVGKVEPHHCSGRSIFSGKNIDTFSIKQTQREKINFVNLYVLFIPHNSTK